MAPETSPRLTPADIVQRAFNYASGGALRTTLGVFRIVADTTATLAAGESADIALDRANANGAQRRFRILAVCVGTAGRNCKVDILHRLLPASSLTLRHRDDYDGTQVTDHYQAYDAELHVRNALVRITHDAGAAAAYEYCIILEDLQTIEQHGDQEA